MKKYLFTSGAFVLALAMNGLPAIALAENNSGEGGADTQVTAVTQVRVSDDVDTSVTGSARVNDDDDEATSSNRRNDDNATSSKSGDDTESINNDQDDQDEFEFEFELEDDKDIAFSLDDLNQKIENRKLELDDEEASTTEQNRGIVKNANEVRLAVHALLASKDLIGGIGPKVSEIAKRMNDSVATTTNAEAKIQSRSFLARLFFGGDSAAADVISQAVAQNQQRIDDLTKLLGEANVSVDIQIVLKAQITALQTAQVRLQDLAQREQKMWGLFSWRF